MAVTWRRRVIPVLIQQHDSKCFYCGKHVVDGENLTVDHVVPKSKGGGNGQDNLLLACFDCNNMRGSVPIAQFYEYRVRALAKFATGGMCPMDAERNLIWPIAVADLGYLCRWCGVLHATEADAAECTRWHIQDFVISVVADNCRLYLRREEVLRPVPLPAAEEPTSVFPMVDPARELLRRAPEAVKAGSSTFTGKRR